MSKRHALILISFAMFIILASGCIPPLSVNPLYTGNDIAYDPDIMGKWFQTGEIMGNEQWTFTKDGGDHYKVKMGEGEYCSSYIAYLFKVNDCLYMDFYPDLDSFNPNLQSNPLWIPAHMFFKANKTESKIELISLNKDFLLSYLKEHTDALPHEFVYDEKDMSSTGSDSMILLLTAPAEKLQEFLIKTQYINPVFQGFVITLERSTPDNPTLQKNNYRYHKSKTYRGIHRKNSLQ